MFWDKAYTPSQNIEALLEKEDATVEEFLDDEDILQECKTQKKNIICYFTRPEIIKRLVELVTTEPSEDLPLAQRFRHANMACEILTIGLPSLDEKLLSDSETLHTLYSYLENEPPLNPLLSSFFSKTFSMLFTKKPEQDWFLYQQMCLKLLEYIKSQNNFLDLIIRHFSTTVMPDLLMQMMRDVEGSALKKNLYEWLTEEKLVERLIAILANPKETEKHTNVSEFLCDLIFQGRSMRQNELENDSFEPAFVGSNPLLQIIESEASLEALMNVILESSAAESAIISGISVVLTLVKPVVFVDEPITDRTKIIHNRERENHDQIISTVIRVVAPRLKDLNDLLNNPPKKSDIATASSLSPPFGMTRLQVCRFFTVLLETGNEEVLRAICATDYFETLLALFKQYSWNNFLHSEVEKCFHIIFYTNQSSNNHNNSTMTTQSTSDTDLSTFIIGTVTASSSANGRSTSSENSNCNNETSTDNNPSALQKHAISKCKVISKLIDCWEHNRKLENDELGRRLGYMGHLIKIFKHICASISESDHIGALIESSLHDADEMDTWKSITNPDDGELTKTLSIQNKMLANCNAHEAADYSQHLPKEFLNENIATEYINDFSPSLSNNLEVDYGMLVNDPTLGSKFEEKILALGEQMQIYVNDFLDNDENMDHDNIAMVQFNNCDKTGKNRQSVLEKFGVTNNPWDTTESLNDLTSVTSSDSCAPWATDFSSDNFADFDAHFSSFTNDLGECLSATEGSECVKNKEVKISENNLFPAFSSFDEEYDSNANVENVSSNNSAAAAQNIFSMDQSSKSQKDMLEEHSPAKDDEDDTDDYEDDDGIWAKPVGSAINEKDNEPLVTNGPTTNHHNYDDDVQLNNLNTDISVPKKSASDLLRSTKEEIYTAVNINNELLPKPDITEETKCADANEKNTSAIIS